MIDHDSSYDRKLYTKKKKKSDRLPRFTVEPKSVNNFRDE